MKRLTMIIAIAIAANFAVFEISPLKAEDAHHPAGAAKAQKTQTNESNKLSVAKASKPTKKPSSTQSSQMRMMSCPMMKGGKMSQGGMMAQGKMMKCPMMASRGSMMQGMNMMEGAGSPTPMGPLAMGRTMQHGETMMGRPDQCWVSTDRDRGYGYSDTCRR